MVPTWGAFLKGFTTRGAFLKGVTSKKCDLPISSLQGGMWGAVVLPASLVVLCGYHLVLPTSQPQIGRETRTEPSGGNASEVIILECASTTALQTVATCHTDPHQLARNKPQPHPRIAIGA